ncbi:hypothetical protein [Anaerobium acetethylicum]|uniref:Toxin with a H, D/N and C signature n=1 Tax=Anaerobium acetethylicum TaxID=1619234 RepID=A0A1D3TZE1_9FIRM|nr:hypothetical protein [Anaerobium acetethylicum]SCP99925.1 Toxin with a H, D/N and C signature [Anaerobium acetethylicum]
MIPVFGIVFDGANGIWYLAAGDTLNAGLSGAACIPVVGEFATGGKLTVRATSKAISMTARHADEAAEVAEFVIKNGDEVVEGTIGTVSRGKLSDYLGVPEYSNNGKFYSVENANGGKVYVSNDPIDQSHFEDIPYFEDGNVNILSGVHGDEFGNLHFDDDAIEFFNQDVNRFKNMSNVNVYDMSKMEGASIYEMINSGDTTILGWCWSENYSLARTVKPKN